MLPRPAVVNQPLSEPDSPTARLHGGKDTRPMMGQYLTLTVSDLTTGSATQPQVIGPQEVCSGSKQPFGHTRIFFPPNSTIFRFILNSKMSECLPSYTGHWRLMHSLLRNLAGTPQFLGTDYFK